MAAGRDMADRGEQHLPGLHGAAAQQPPFGHGYGKPQRRVRIVFQGPGHRLLYRRVLGVQQAHRGGFLRGAPVHGGLFRHG